MCENAYLNTAARIQQHIGSRVATPTTAGKDYPATCRTSQGQQINNTRRVNLLNHYTPANTTTQTSPDTEITVPVPELDKIGVRRTVWYSDEASHGPRNLLNSFNKVGENSGSGRTDIGLSEDCHGPEFESTSTNNNVGGHERLQNACGSSSEVSKAGRSRITIVKQVFSESCENYLCIFALVVCTKKSFYVD
ncbi:uncharacterized protein LOC108200196 isoform X2 [Daucus carota subsp. sativus]|uniref:uncharacterized protein LOC108200196 isoform X2 n=1 Tax=Daucus carota subsp. sativus TaxID=79200 RepID=UPI0007F021E9|nr:PREDICTED: uncharacterized protein LOC108200196 isoform X2 [Daucus carota subsp. sativus]